MEGAARGDEMGFSLGNTHPTAAAVRRRSCVFGTFFARVVFLFFLEPPSSDSLARGAGGWEAETDKPLPRGSLERDVAPTTWPVLELRRSVHAAGLPLCPSPDPEPKGPKYWDSKLIHILLLSRQPPTNLEIPAGPNIPCLSLVLFLVAPRAVTRSCLSPPCASGHRAPQAVSPRLDAVPTTWCLSQNDQPVVPFPISAGHHSTLILALGFRARPCPTAAPAPQNRRRRWPPGQRRSADGHFSPLNPPVQPQHGPILLLPPCGAARRGSGCGCKSVPPAAPVPGGCQP